MSFLFVGDVNVHHEEWHGSSTTNLPGRAASAFASSSGWEHIFIEPAHIDGGLLGLVLTDVPDIVEVRVGSPVGTTDHIAIFKDVC